MLSIRSITAIGVLLVCFARATDAAETVIDVSFDDTSAAVSDRAQPLHIVTARPISQAYSTGGLYLLSGFAPSDGLFAETNQEMIDRPWIEQPWRFCSAFACAGAGTFWVGRNWDNQNVGSILVSLYSPPSGHRSVCLSRAIDIGFGENLDLAGMIRSDYGGRFDVAPFYAVEGMNDAGLVVITTGINTIPVHATPEKRPLFITYLIRQMLDRCGTVAEAVALADRFTPFDLDTNSLSCHLLIADKSGASVVLEHDGHKWASFAPEGSFQIMTNKPLLGLSDTDLKSICWRYRSLAEDLDSLGTGLTRTRAHEMLHRVEQSGTTWSAVYDPAERCLYLSVYQDWDRIYRLALP
ncbi:MAG TPA: carcinine hydrolase/isopenicillin-N N-acyltransferase family protein [candidate division Zixibacteria bacterium]|nr:carcinine hydrolase/isopenicillin-N N-acyltransferase family protein [candidate division Zixibacteria bacterium]